MALIVQDQIANLKQELYKFSQNGVQTDLKIVSEGGTAYLHKAIIFGLLPSLKNILTQTHFEEDICIVLPEANFENLTASVRRLYLDLDASDLATIVTGEKEYKTDIHNDIQVKSEALEEDIVEIKEFHLEESKDSDKEYSETLIEYKEDGSNEANGNNETTVKNKIVIWKCAFCNKPFTRKSNLKLHERLKHSENGHAENLLENKYLCNLCDKYFSSKRSLILHQSRKHGKKILKNQHKSSEKVPCPICKQICSNKAMLDRHIKLAHTRVTCTVCNMSLINQYYLKNHMKIHTGEIKMPCEACGLSFSGPHSLRTHFLTKHTTERPVKCPQCDFATINRKRLTHHVESKHMDNKYPCFVCGMDFKTKMFLKRHEKDVHTSEKTFKCDLCEKSFKRKAHLQKHTANLHSTIKITCKECGKVFPSEQYMEEHARQHDAQNHLPCPFCEKTFTRKMKLQEHINIHTGNTPYSCPQVQCGRKFKSSSSLAHHKKSCSAMITT